MFGKYSQYSEKEKFCALQVQNYTEAGVQFC